jgi:hypothetical protein
MSSTFVPSDRCLPVEKRDDHYVVLADWIECNLPFPHIDELSKLLAKPFRRTTSYVHFGGRKLSATVFVPESREELSYALVEGEQKSSWLAQNREEFVNSLVWYRSQLESECSTFEWMVPEQRGMLRADFVDPYFQSISDQSRSVVPWSQARHNQRLFITGMAGSGKTTVLRKWALELAGHSPVAGTAVVPIYVRLRDWTEDDSVLIVVKRHLSKNGGEWLASHFDQLATSGKLAIAFDGLDEVPDERRERVTTLLSEFSDRYDRCKVMISARSPAMSDYFGEYTKLELKPLNESQIRELVFHKLHRHKQWRHFWSRLLAERQLLEVCSNPLLLTLLLARHLRGELFPGFATEALSVVVNALVDEWDSTRGVVRSPAAELSPTRKSMFLRLVAGLLTRTNRHSCRTDEVSALLEQLYPDTSAPKMLLLLEQHTSLIVNQNDGSWAFRHAVLQEFFASMHWIDRLTSSVDDLVNAIVHRTDSYLKGSLRYLAGMSSEASEAFTRALRAAPPYRPDVAIALSEAMTQRLAVDRATVEGYAAYVRIVLEELVGMAEVTVSTAKEDGVLCQICVQRELDGEGPQWAARIAQLLGVLHRGRDGSAKGVVGLALQASNDERVRNMAQLLELEGRYAFDVASEQERCVATIRITAESQDVPDYDI